MTRKLLASGAFAAAALAAQAQTTGPEMLDPRLQVRTVASGLNLPIGPV